MDAGSFTSSFSSSTGKTQPSPRQPLAKVGSTVYIPSLRSSASNPSSYRPSGDRFIPDRSAMDFDVARYLLSQPPRREKENVETVSPAKEAYRKLLAETLLNNRTRILAFNRKPPFSAGSMLAAISESDASGNGKITNKTRRYIPQSAERALDAPGLLDDIYLNLLDWGSRNVLSLALGAAVYVWDASQGSVSKLVTCSEDVGLVTSVSWAPDGQSLAVGFSNSHVQLWDCCSARLLRTLKGIHESGFGTLAWNNNSVLTTGGFDGKIINNDVRIRNHVASIYRGHRQEVCGLKWSASGKRLASGGNDNLLHVWDVCMASTSTSRYRKQWLHRFDGHNSAVKALAWCPFQSNLLASGGGHDDKCIKFWNTLTGACLNSIDTGSQVSALLWNKKERELLSSHGFAQNQLALWRYPSMVKMAELCGHTSRVLSMVESPDGCTVATIAGDETLRFWNVFGDPKLDKPATKAAHSEPFANYSRIR